MSDTMIRPVAFFVDGQKHQIDVIDAPTLTANVLELKYAAKIPADYNFALDARMENLVMLSDKESVVLSPGGTTKFMSWPQGVIHG